MKKMLVRGLMFIQSLKNREEGQGMVEYGLIIALIAVVVIGVLVFLGGSISNIFNHVANQINSVS